MRTTGVFLLLIASLGMSACTVSWSGQPPGGRWTTGFWFWQGSTLDAAYSGQPLDVLFVQVGTIRKETLPLYARQTPTATEQWYANGELQRDLPAARDYWLVFRYERQGVPDLEVAPIVAREVSRLKMIARSRNLNVVGVQLDVDSPTSALARYGAFLRKVRESLPSGTAISITALLDWFHSGTALDEVIAQVDEFVPQFYDLGDSDDSDGRCAIAARIDPARWAPLFNRFRKPFRVGISSFGRARVIPQQQGTPTPYRRVVYYGDLRPLDIAISPGFELQATRSAADEMVLNYRATRKIPTSYGGFERGETVQFVVSTPEAIRTAVQSARQIGGYLAGVVFFRWPASNETWAMQPDEVQDATGGATPGPRQNRIHAVEGHCAAVECGDVYLEAAGPLSPRPTRYRVRASAELEYFLPERNVPVRLAGASELEISLPPYCSRGRLYLGRAVSRKHAEFTVEQEQ